jgi:hypothetical protein
MWHRTFLVLAVAACAQAAAAETSIGVSMGTGSFEFDFIYRDYGATEPAAVERGVACLGEVDYVVALHLARVAHVDVDILIARRRAGLSWDAITRGCGQGGRIYYVELEPAVASGPPFGRAYGYWRKHPRGDLRLTDAEIRELVVVKSLARHCGASPSRVAEMRRSGKGPRTIAAAHGRGRGPVEDTAPGHRPEQRSKPGKAKKK